jgi:hypothetical protein
MQLYLAWSIYQSSRQSQPGKEAQKCEITATAIILTAVKIINDIDKVAKFGV